MTARKFRELALGLPDVVESSHMNHSDFRVSGKIFATLSEDESWGMVKLTPVQQAEVVADHPEMFIIFDNAWGRQGCTKVLLKHAKVQPLMAVMKLAWKGLLKK